ncbi:11933_t:CDS:1, partial [Gigaspora margarita]
MHAIPAIFVPSKRLFSDANLHLSAHHSCLKPELLASMLFLKRDMKLFDIFKLEDK